MYVYINLCTYLGYLFIYLCADLPYAIEAPKSHDAIIKIFQMYAHITELTSNSNSNNHKEH